MDLGVESLGKLIASICIFIIVIYYSKQDTDDK